MIKEKKHFMVLVPMMVLLFMFLLSTKAYAHYKGTCPECGSSNCTYHTTENMCPHQYITSYSCHDCGATGEALQGTRDYDIVYKAPTCTQSGGYVCSWCGHLEYGYEAPLGHNYSTCTYYSATQHVKTCSRCGDKVYGNHTYAYVPIDGNVHSKYCTECGYSIEEAHVDANGDGICDICGGSLDTEPPTASHNLSITGWTNGSVTIDLTAADTLSGIADIQLPDGSAVSADTVSYTVTANDAYTFIVIDQAGNELNYSVTVDNIDKELPTASHTLSPDSWTNGGVTIDLTAADTLSGIADIQLPDGSVISADTASYVVTANDAYTFIVIDQAGNELNYSVTVDNIDKELPTASHTLSPDSWTNGGVIIDLTTADSLSGVVGIQFPDGSLVSGNTASYTVTANGSYVFTVTDHAGNALSYSVTVDNIDTEPPTASHSLSLNAWANGSVTINLTAADTLSGVADIQLPDGTVVSTDTAGYTVSTNGTYTFIVTDHVGNTLNHSVTVDTIDKEKPTVSHTLSPSGWTNGGVTINLTADDALSGVASIRKPDGTTATGSSASYTVTDNGSYVFTVTDHAGNTLDYRVTVGNIDKSAPDASHTVSTTVWTNLNVTIHLTADDDLSGVSRILLPDGTTVTGSSASYTVTANGTYVFTVKDNAGNTFPYSVTISNIDKVLPTVSHTLSTTSWTNNRVTINLTADDALSGVASIQLPDGSVVTSNSASYTVTANGTYAFTVTDNASNVLAYSVTVSNIDMTAPSAEYALSETEWTNEDVTINMRTADALSGVASIQLPDGSAASSSSASFTVSANGTYAFIVTDLAGNELTYSVTVGNIDTTAPSVEYAVSEVEWTNKDVTIKLRTADGLSGVASIQLPDGSVVTGSSASYTVPENGTYTFIVSDQAGNAMTLDVEINNIDKEQPTSPEVKYITTDKSLGIGLEAIEHSSFALSGIMKYQYSILCLSGAETVSVKSTDTGEAWQNLNDEIIIESEGIYQVKIRAISNAGNISEVANYTVINDFTAPTAQLLMVGDTLSIEAWDGISGVESIALPDGSVIAADKAVFSVSENGTYAFTVADKAGNEYLCSYEVTTMDTSFWVSIFNNPVGIGASISLLFLILILMIVLIVRRRKGREEN